MSQTSKLLILHALLMGCTSDDLPPVRARSEWFILRGPADLEICGATFSMMKSEVEQIRTTFKSKPRTVDYSWMPESLYDAATFPCTPSSVWACTSAYSKISEVYARSLVESHELVHAARDAALPSVLEEGLATMLHQPSTGDDETIVSRVELLEALESGTWHNASNGHGLYQRSAHFISFLFAEFGQDRFVELEQRIGATVPIESDIRPLNDWESEFQVVYGQSFTDVWAAYQDYPDCASARFKLPLTACGALDDVPDATLVPSFGGIGTEGKLIPVFECADDDTFGPYTWTDGAFVRAAIYTLELDNPSDLVVLIQLTGEITDSTRALLTNCGNCWDGAGVLLTNSKPSEVMSLPSGTYALILYQDFDEPAPVGIEVGY